MGLLSSVVLEKTASFAFLSKKLCKFCVHRLLFDGNGATHVTRGEKKKCVTD
jgi:hypothetical protein